MLKPSLVDRALRIYRQDYPYMKEPDALWGIAQAAKGTRQCRRAMKNWRTAQHILSGICHTLQSHEFYTGIK